VEERDGRKVDELMVEVMYTGPGPLTGDRLDGVASGSHRSVAMNCATGRWSPAASPGREVALASTKELGRRMGNVAMATSMQIS
jgi:hypothetical protein